MKRLLVIAILVPVIACESDEAKLERLKVAQATACLPVARADSEERSYAALVGRTEAIERGEAVYGPGSLAQARADADEAKRWLSKMEAATIESTANPMKYAEKKQAKEKQRIVCELATRDYNRFMR